MAIVQLPVVKRPPLKVEAKSFISTASSALVVGAVSDIYIQAKPEIAVDCDKLL